jgi:hypothetical protein
LRLSEEERDHLYTVAGQAPPKRTTISSSVTPGVQRLLDRLGDIPVAVYDAAWTIITWNPSWAALMGDPSNPTGWDRNVVWRTFTAGNSRVHKNTTELSAFRCSAVADLRRALGTYPDDPGLQQLIADLLEASPRFARLWRQRIVSLEDPKPKTVVHPQVGPITVDCDVLTVAGTDVRLVVYTTAPGSGEAAKLDLVRVIGLQQLGEATPTPRRSLTRRP